LVIASSLSNNGGFSTGFNAGYGGNAFANPLGTAVLSQSFGGGVNGALLANAVTGAPASNLLPTVALSGALGGSTGTTGSSDLTTPLLIASLASNNQYGGNTQYGGSFAPPPPTYYQPAYQPTYQPAYQPAFNGYASWRG
jgi:hypothetical protein